MNLILLIFSLADYYEDVSKYPSLLNLDKLSKLNYLMYSIKNRNKAGIYDRSPFAVILYSIIRDKSFNLDNLSTTFNQIKQLNLIDCNEKFLILLPEPSNFPIVLELMIKRGNNIDELTEDYISRQYKVFFEFAKFFSFPTFIVNHDPNHIKDSQNLLYNNVVYLFSSTIYMSTSVTKAYPSDAAFDLTLADDYCIKPSQKVKLLFREKIVIPINFAGLICARSSINQVGCLRVGVVDATFNGQLSAIFIADGEELSFKKNQRIAQLIIFPIASQLPVIISANLPNLLRGQNSYGSTGQF